MGTSLAHMGDICEARESCQKRPGERGYYYEHTNGEVLWKSAVTVNAAGGPEEYFDSPFVKRWWREGDLAHVLCEHCGADYQQRKMEGYTWPPTRCGACGSGEVEVQI